MITWEMPFMVKRRNGNIIWEWHKVQSNDSVQDGNKYAAAEDHKNARADIVGYDASQAWGYWPDGRRI